MSRTISSMRLFPHVVAVMVVIGIGHLTASTSLAGDLTAEQQKWLGEAVAGIKQAATNFKLAEGSVPAGNKPLKGSRLKLAMSRLASAKAPMPQIAKKLAKLPAGDPQVKKVQAQYDQLKGAMDAFETRITGQAATDPAAESEGVKLDYRQEEELKNAKFSLRDLEGRAAALTQLVEQIKPKKDKRLVDHRLVQKGMNTLEVAERRTREAHNHLDPLPKDGRGVKPTRERLGKAVDSVAASKAYLTPIHKQLSALIDPANYPELKADLDRLRELSAMYANPRILVENREQAAAVIKEAQAAVAERERLVKKYAILAHQQTDDGKHFVGVSNAFTQNYFEFAAAAKEQKKVLPGQIQKDLDEVRRMAAEAVEKKKPLFFTGGIPQMLGFAEKKLALLERLDVEAAKRLKGEIAKTRADIKAKQDSLREMIINANELPADEYKADARKALEKLVSKVWKQQQPDAEILAIRFPAPNWKRSVRWQYSNGTWYKVDHSKLQAQLIIKYDDKLAVNQPVDLWKDHLSNDEVKAYPFRSMKDELSPQAFLLLEKVK